MNGILSTPDPYALIQARLGSTRLSGKILQCIPQSSTTTLLDHIYFRLRNILEHERIIFIIPENEIELSNFLRERNYLYFAGSLEDVRDRYIKAAEHFQIKDIIRLTGDNPFIDLTSIELLWEAMFYLKSRYYCLAMQGLPLGMGVECFSYESLIFKNEIFNEKRHTEHVSLHIKENPSENQIIKLIAPHLSPKQFHISTKIRMTVDEDLDLQLLRQVWDHLSPKNEFFGANEVLSLYDEKPDLFSLNQSVNQIKFDLPKQTEEQQRIHIQYGDPKVFGSGHFERCKSLSIEIQMKNILVECNSDFSSQYDGYIYDSREIVGKKSPALYIDFMAEKSLNSNYIYFLPHHELTDPKTENVSFYTSPLLDYYRNRVSQNGTWLVYVGSLNHEECESLDRFLIERLTSNWQIQNIHRIGGAPPSSNFEKRIKHSVRVTKIGFYRLLADSEGLVSYFGQSIMESIYLKKNTVLFGMTEVHKSLGNFFSQLAKIDYIGEPFNFQIPNGYLQKSSLVLKRDAQNQIFHWLESIKK